MQRRQGAGLGVGLLLLQMFQMGFDQIPPVTLVLVGTQIAVYLELLQTGLSTGDVCASVLNVWFREDYRRLLLAAFFHMSDWHLYYNMLSFLWKGRVLERHLGSTYFAYIIGTFAVLTNATMVALNFLAEQYLDKSSYITDCAVGFSGVLFALKVLMSTYHHGSEYIMGVPLPSKYACWAELLLIQLLVPNVSFTGHLAGILVGLAYVYGPLKFILDLPFEVLNLAGIRTISTSSSRFHGSGQASGRRSWFSPGPSASSPRPAYPVPGGYHGDANSYGGAHQQQEQEQEDRELQQAIQNSLRDQQNRHLPTAEHYTNRLPAGSELPDLGHGTANSSSIRINPQPTGDVNMRPNAEEIRQRRLARLKKNRPNVVNS